MVPYRPQANLAGSVNSTFIQLISSHVGRLHKNWDWYLNQFIYALGTTVHGAGGTFFG